MKGLIRAAARRPVATAMVWLGILLFGAMAMTEIPLDYLPEISYPRVVVSTSYPGMPAEEVRTLVTVPLEDAFASIKGVKTIQSVSREGRSVVSLDFHWGEDTLSASIRTREAIDAAYTGLPEGCDKPVAFPSDPGAVAVITLALVPTGADLTLTRSLAETDVRTRLQQAEGVGAVNLVGGAQTEYRVAVQEDKAAARGLTVSAVAQFLGRENFDYPVGSIRSGESEIIIKTRGRASTASELESLRIPMENGSLQLSQIAGVEEAEKHRLSVYAFDGKEAVALEVFRRKGSNPVAVAQAVRKEAERVAQAYAGDFEVAVDYDSSVAIVESIRNLAVAALSGILITFVVLLALTRDAKGSALLVVTIPVSIMVGVAALRLMGRTLNTMSLGGIALGIGMIVDNAIVVLDALKRLPAARRRDPAAVSAQVERVFTSIMASTITSLIVFVPVIFLPGVIGAIFTDLALSVIFTQFGGFLTAITVIPVAFMSFRWKDDDGARDPMEPARKLYARALDACFRRPALVALIIGLTFLAGAGAATALGFEFMPVDDAPLLELEVAFPYGTRLEHIAAEAAVMQGSILADGAFLSVSARAGGEREDALYQSDPASRPERLIMRAVLDRRRASVEEAMDRARKAVESLGYACEVRPPKDAVETLLGVGGSTRSWAAYGKDPEEARSRAALALLHARSVAGGDRALSLNPAGERDEIRVSPDRAALAALSVGFYDAATALHAAVEGEVASRIVVDSREKDVRVGLAGADGQAPDIGRVIIRPQGPIRVADVARVQAQSSVPLFLRVDRKDAVLLEAEAAPGSRDDLAAAMAGFSAGHGWLESADASALAEYGGRILLTLGIVVALLYLTLGAQFESFSLPVLLLVTIPLSFSGIALALAISGTTVNFGSALGVIVLFGVAVNNSIVLYEVTSQKAGESGAGDEAEPGRRRSLADAAARAGALERLSPILSTVLTTVVAIFPILLSPSGASQKAMSIAVIGGLVVSTVLTLFTAPLVFARRLGGKASKERHEA